MNRKTIISLSTIAVIAIIVIGATTAYFSNTEKSVGNTFIAGAIDLKIDNECHYNEMVCTNGVWKGPAGGYPVLDSPCTCTWGLMDLKGKAIFNFLDVKPGDYGESTISLHVDSNPAWVCAEISNVAQTENGCNPPEAKVDGTCGNPGLGEGELYDNLYFDVWRDNGAGGGTVCDNIRNGSEPYIIQNAKFTDLDKWPIADSTTGSPIQDACIGIAWNVPSTVDNIIQGDSVTGDITFRAYQARNNDGFLCNPPQNSCGDEIVTPPETCELPNTTNNSYCGQSISQCVGPKLQTRDAFGNCGEICGCVYDGWSAPVCDMQICSAGCAVDADCPDRPNTTKSCNLDTCGCVYTPVPYCGDGIVNQGSEQCDDGNILPNDGCSSACENEYAYLVVQKYVVNNGVGAKNPGEFQMTIDTVNVAQNVATSVAANVSHAVSEVDTFGYVKTYSADCDTNGNVTVSYNQTKTCAVINTFPVGTITVTKVVVNDDGGNATVSNFSLYVGTTGVTSGTSKNFAPGIYLVSELGVFGYDARFSGDCNPDTQLITISAGESKTCTITNNDIKPVVSLLKNVINNGSGSATPYSFIMRVDGMSVPHGTSRSVTANIDHQITEDALAGYHWVSITGASCPTALGQNFQLTPGQSITCTITNDDN